MGRMERKQGTSKIHKKRRSFKSWFKGLKTWKKVALIAGTVLLVLLIAAFIIVYSYFNGIFDEIHEETPEDYDLSLVDVDGYYNILLLGVDSRDMKHLKGTRSDAIMIVSINKDTNDVKILSIYRDTFMKMGDNSTYDKITHACALGGPEFAMKTLNQSLDLNISNYVVVNFKAVADLVDAVGGIEVDVKEQEILELNKYTASTAMNIGRKDYNLVKEPGVQTLEGAQAVSYGRIRKGVGDDFKRTERMRTVITLVMDKMQDMSFKEIKKIIKMMTPQVQTNLSKSNILGLGIRLPQYNITGTDGWPYNVSTGYINEVSYVFPDNLAENVKELHKKFFGREDYVPSSKVTSISDTIAQKIEAERNAGNIQGEENMNLDTSQNNQSKPPVDQGSGGSGNDGNNTGGSGGSTDDGGSGNAGGGNSGSTGDGNSGNTGDGGSGNTGGGDSGDGTEGGITEESSYRNVTSIIQPAIRKFSEFAA